MKEPQIRLKRAYDAASGSDGHRVLVDRLWPRGRSRAALALDDWCKDLAPSDELRRWFGHDPSRWPEFQRRYRAELRDKVELLDALLDQAQPCLTLVFAAADEERNQAVVLRKRLLERFRKRRVHQ